MVASFERTAALSIAANRRITSYNVCYTKLLRAVVADLVDRFCTDCHNQAEFAGQLALDSPELTDVEAHAEVWEKVARKLV